VNTLHKGDDGGGDDDDNNNDDHSVCLVQKILVIMVVKKDITIVEAKGLSTQTLSGITSVYPTSSHFA
jgi:hypothetical protein